MISLEDAGGAEEREVWASQLDVLMLLQVQLHRRRCPSVLVSSLSEQPG